MRIIASAVIALAGGFIVVTDALGIGTGLQYAFNAAYFVMVLPYAIHLSGIIRHNHPEYYKSIR